MIQLDAPYVAGFLAFREADFLIDKVESLRKNQPGLTPQAIIVDGNGILHPKGDIVHAIEDLEIIVFGQGVILGPWAYYVCFLLLICSRNYH